MRVTRAYIWCAVVVSAFAGAATLLACALAPLIALAIFVQVLVSTPCPTEDSDWCYWDAAERGNGEGRSFTDYGGVIVYWNPAP